MKIYLFTITCALLSTGLTGCAGDGPCQMEVETIDSLTLSLPPLGLPVYRSSGSVDGAADDQSLELIGYNDRRHALDFMTSRTDSFSRSVPLTKEGPQSIPEVYYLMVLTEDSIALFSRDQLTVVDRQGTILTKIRTQAKSDSTAEAAGFLDYEPYLSSDRSLHGYFAESSGDLIVPLNYLQADPFSFPAAYAADVHLLGTLNLRTRETRLLPVHYPDRFRENFYGLLVSPIVNFIDENEVIYGFLGFPEIYKTDLRTGRTTVSQPRCVNCSGLPSPYEGASGDARDTETYLRSHTRYVNLIWSEAEQKIYRFFLSPLPDQPTRSELFVSVHDRELNYLGESKVPSRLMYFGGIPSARGFYLPKVTQNEDQLLLIEIAASDCKE